MVTVMLCRATMLRRLYEVAAGPNDCQITFATQHRELESETV